MKQKLLQKTLLLLFALIAGSTSVWADDDPNWTGTVVSSTSKLNTTDKTYTFTVSEVDYVWSYENSVAYAGEPGVTIGNPDSKSSLKFGSSKSIYFKPVILTTSAFSDKAITKVNIYLKHNGSKAGNLTVKQGDITIGTASTSSTNTWLDVTCSETNKGAGGTLEIKYEVDQALYINKIEVWYETLGTATTTTIDPSGITNTDVYTSTAAGSLSANVKEKISGDPVVGATVTWSSSNEDVATIASDGKVTLKKKGSTTITASYAGNATYAASTAEYVLNVTSSAPQETDISVITNYEWLGVESGKNIAAADLPKVFDCEGVTLTLGDGGTTKPRGDDTNIRVYQDNAFTFEAPDNYLIKSIVFTAGSNWQKDFEADNGTYTSATKTWTGLAKNVTLTVESGSGNNYISKIQIILVAYKEVTITTADYATFCSAVDLDFSTTDITVYKAKVESNKVKFTEVSDGLVKAGEGVLLYKDVDAETVVNVPVTTGVAALSENELVGVTAETAVAYNPTSGVYNYILQMDGANLVFRKATGAKLRANRAYLSTSYDVTAPGARELEVSFGDETAINALENSNKVNDGAIYDLSGRRVENPTKGIYIMNGKKYVVK